jgi:hypothetical protein
VLLGVQILGKGRRNVLATVALESGGLPGDAFRANPRNPAMPNPSLRGLLVTCMLSLAAQAGTGDSNLAGGPAPSPADAIECLLWDDDVVPGLPGLLSFTKVTSLDDSGSWALNGTVAGIDFTMIDGALASVEGDPLLPLANPLAFETLLLTNDGHRVRSVNTILPPNSTFQHHVFIDDVMLIQEGGPSQLGSYYYQPRVVAAADNGQAMIYSRVPQDNINLVSFNSLGMLINEVNLVAEGSPAAWLSAGLLLTNQINSIPESTALTDSGDWVFNARTSDLTWWVVKNNTVVAQLGGPSPLAGYEWASLSPTNFQLAANDAGQVALRAGITQSGANYKTGIFVDDHYVIGTGDVMPGHPGTVQSVQPWGLGLDEEGRAIYAAAVGPSGTNFVNAHFRDQETLVREYATSFEGVLFTNVLGSSISARSKNGRWLAFQGTLGDGRRGWFRVDVPVLLGDSWSDAPGTGIAGQAGTPNLQGTGLLETSEDYSLAVTGGAPDALLTLVLGLSQISVPFKGGVLVPAPDLLLDGLTLDAGGSWSLSSQWPPGIGAGASFWLQAWIVDPTAAGGLAASDGLQGTTS